MNTDQGEGKTFTTEDMEKNRRAQREAGIFTA